MTKGLGDRIKSVRLKIGAAQKEFGKNFDVSPSAISSYERGEKTPQVDTLAKIAAMGGVSLDWLITGKEAATQTKIVTREEALKEVARAAYQGDKSFARGICEAAGLYVTENGLEKEEVLLIEAYRCASEEIREEALGMLKRSAERSKGRGGGESDSQQQNSA
jgi:transcriptional regulator with XRE-family HTH domain